MWKLYLIAAVILFGFVAHYFSLIDKVAVLKDIAYEQAASILAQDESAKAQAENEATTQAHLDTITKEVEENEATDADTAPVLLNAISRLR